MKRIGLLGVLAGFLLLLVFGFQNCAKTQFTEVPISEDFPSGSDGGNDGSSYPSGTDGVTFSRKVTQTVGSETTNNNIQLLVVVDDSTSMVNSRDKLAKQSGNLVSSLKGKDLQVGVTTIWYDPGLSGTRYYDGQGKLISNIGDWSAYVGQTIKIVRDYRPPGLVELNYKKLFAAYGYPDCIGYGSYAPSICKSSDSKLLYIKSLITPKSCSTANAYIGRCEGTGIKTFSFSKAMTAEQFEILSKGLELTISGVPPKYSEGEMYERGLCVISSYLADTSTDAFIKSTSKVGVVIISDEDDYSGIKKEKCRQFQEQTFNVQRKNVRNYQGKFRSRIPLGGDATLTDRQMRYSYQRCEKKETRTHDVYSDGVFVRTETEIVTTDIRYTLPCPTGYEQVTAINEKFSFKALEAGTYGASCSASDINTGTTAAGSQNQHQGITVLSCSTPTPYWYTYFPANDGKVIDLVIPSDVDGAAKNLCTNSFVSEGISYAHLLDYNYKIQFQSASYLEPIAGSCAYTDSEIIDKTYLQSVIKDIIPVGSDFGQALSSISKNRFNGGVYMTSIIHTNTSCGLVGSQSVGLQFLKLSQSTMLGSHAKSSSICASDYADPIANLASQVSIIQKQFKIDPPLAANEVIMGVAIILQSGQVTQVPARDVSYSSGYLTVNSNALVAGARIEISVGYK